MWQIIPSVGSKPDISPQKLTFWVLCLSELALDTHENPAAPWQLISSNTWVHILAVTTP